MFGVSISLVEILYLDFSWLSKSCKKKKKSGNRKSVIVLPAERYCFLEAPVTHLLLFSDPFSFVWRNYNVTIAFNTYMRVWNKVRYLFQGRHRMRNRILFFWKKRWVCINVRPVLDHNPQSYFCDRIYEWRFRKNPEIRILRAYMKTSCLSSGIRRQYTARRTYSSVSSSVRKPGYVSIYM